MSSLMVLSVGLMVSFAWCQSGAGKPPVLQGIVLSHDGKPVYGAFIYLDPPEGDLPEHIRDRQLDRPDSLSRMNGQFFIMKSPGKYRLTVWIGKQRVFVMPIELKDEEQKVEVHLPPLPAIRGKLIDQEGNPVPQMMVVLINPESKESRMAISDKEGEFTLLIPPLGEATISVMLPTGEHKLVEQKIVVTGDKDQELTLQLPSMPRLTVLILKGDGILLANASVLVTFGFTSNELKTDNKGLLTLPLLSQTDSQKVLLRAENEGWAIVSVEPKRLPSRILVVRLQPFASVSGKVVTPDGKSVEGVEVKVAPVTPNPFPFGNLEQSVRTDKQGQFKVGGLWAGNYLFRIQDNRYRLPGLGLGFWLSPGQSKSLTVTVAPVKELTERKATIIGQVFDADGRTVPEATVQLNKQLPSPLGYMEAQPSKPVKTDEQGRFELTDVPSGWHVLSARTKDGKDAVKWVYVPPSKDGEEQRISVTLQLPKEFGSIKGRVLKDGGKTPAAGVGVMAIESHYYLVNMWGVEGAAENLQIDENQTICVGGG